MNRPPIGTELVSQDGVPGPDSEPPPQGVPAERAVLWARSENLEDVGPAQRSAPYGRQNITVTLHSPDLTHPAILDHYCYEDERTMLACYALARASFPDLPPAAVALCLRLWSRMHGLLTLEIYGHPRHQVTDLGKLYQADIHDLICTLGLTPTPYRNADEWGSSHGMIDLGRR
ncbi:TetR-like C-terminal domain-containing protein [Streptomyces sp. NPDC046853]|uniref:TetR-like C-terminal domain-containing protein n=1 Tax=Streptomyces sp. NPDC046853 TaxID=3154920 RepID=UPI0033EBB301